MINREIPFRPRLEGEFRVRFYNAASEITEKTPTLTIARIAEREIEWVEKDCQYNIEQRKKYRAVWFLFRDLIRASWKACYRNGVIYMSLPTLNGTDMHDTTSPEVKALLRSWMSESRHERLVGYTDFINRMENPGTNKQSIAALIADGDELEKRIKRVHTGEIAIEAAVQPYLQLVRENDRDVFTGLKTSEIWRYFRLTWSTPVETTPGRTMQYLIRDAAHPMHAVMGIASLENCAVQITCRDDYIGWNQKAFIERIVTVDNDHAKEEFKQLLVYLEDGIDGIDYSFRKEVDSTYVGFTPNGGSIKPVHVANGVQRCIFGGFNTAMQIKRLALVSDAKGNVPTGSELETIYAELAKNEAIEDGIAEGSVESMRNVMQRLLSADKGVYVVKGLKDDMISFTAGSKYFLTRSSIYEDTGEFIGGLIHSYCPEL